jgi:hypothetical protein
MSTEIWWRNFFKKTRNEMKSEMDIRERAYEDGDDWGQLNPILWEVVTS